MSAAPVARQGIIAGGLQSVRDLFRWDIRTIVIDEHGNEVEVWERPTAPPNPFRLLGMLSLAGWCAYAIGFFAWTADA
jgi:hypothetical protein